MAAQVEDYFGVAVSIVKRWHWPLLVRFREDVIQECHVLALEAELRHCIVVKNGTKRKRFGTGERKKRLSLRMFTRACNARMYVFRKHYYTF